MKSLVSFFSQLSTGKKVLLLLTPFITLLTNMKLAFIALLVLIFIDLLTGIRKSFFIKNVSLNPLKKIFWLGVKSYLLRRTWRKTYEYLFGIIAIAVFETYMLGITQIELLGKVSSFTEWSVVICGTVEIWSIFENMEAVSGNNILKKLLNFLPENIRRLFIKSEDYNSVENYEDTEKF